MVRTVLECDCGYEASADDEDALVIEIRRHARVEHGMTLSLGEALLLASRAVLVESSGRGHHRAADVRRKEKR